MKLYNSSLRPAAALLTGSAVRPADAAPTLV